MQVKKEDNEAIYIDFGNKKIGGKCKAKNWNKQIKIIQSEII